MWKVFKVFWKGTSKTTVSAFSTLANKFEQALHFVSMF